ncbi:MAG: hypothetical protein NPIRA04_27740 [Nitrospirales bacterium]|nr:MAG: hypothetical protein NPIRA04_27740 [Nitrospirales bacterium]
MVICLFINRIESRVVYSYLLALTSDEAMTSRTKGLSVSFNEHGTVQRLARINYDSQTGGE